MWNIPLYEAKLIWSYDHRFATFRDVSQPEAISGQASEISNLEKSDSQLSIHPKYYLPKNFVNSLFDKYSEYKRNYLLVYRDITGGTNERTCVATMIPKTAASRSLPALGFITKSNPSLLLANLNSIVLDYVVRQKIGGNHLTFTILKQLPIFPPDRYSQADINYITPRVLELTYTAWDIKPFADDLWA